MVKFVKFESSNLSDQQNTEYCRLVNLMHQGSCHTGFLINLRVDKLQTDTETAITSLETICAAAAETITYLTEHSIILETSCKKAAEVLVEVSDHNEDLGKAYDILEEMFISSKKTTQFMDSRCHDLEKRFEALEAQRETDMNKITCSDVIASLGLMVGLIAICVGGMMY